MCGRTCRMLTAKSRSWMFSDYRMPTALTMATLALSLAVMLMVIAGAGWWSVVVMPFYFVLVLAPLALALDGLRRRRAWGLVVSVVACYPTVHFSMLWSLGWTPSGMLLKALAAFAIAAALSSIILAIHLLRAVLKRREKAAA